jgi:hypothetical protein
MRASQCPWGLSEAQDTTSRTGQRKNSGYRSATVFGFTFPIEAVIFRAGWYKVL